MKWIVLVEVDISKSKALGTPRGGLTCFPIMPIQAIEGTDIMTITCCALQSRAELCRTQEYLHYYTSFLAPSLRVLFGGRLAQSGDISLSEGLLLGLATLE